MFRTQVMMLYLSRFSPHSNLRDFPLGCHPGRLSRFHTSDFFCSNVGFHVLANLDFSSFLSRTICIPTKLGSRFLRGDFPVFRPNFNGGPRLSEISLFFARFRRLDSPVGGTRDGFGHYNLFLRTLHHPSQPSLITSA